MTEKFLKSMFAVRDSAMSAFNSPFVVVSRGVAVRSFGDEVNNPQSPMNAHPADFELFHVGFFHEDSGMLVPVEHPELVVRAKDLLKPRE